MVVLGDEEVCWLLPREVDRPAKLERGLRPEACLGSADGICPLCGVSQRHPRLRRVLPCAFPDLGSTSCAWRTTSYASTLSPSEVHGTDDDDNCMLQRHVPTASNQPSRSVCLRAKGLLNFAIAMVLRSLRYVMRAQQKIPMHSITPACNTSLFPMECPTTRILF